MRLKIARAASQIFFGVSGLIFLASAIFAVELGLDNDPGWGKGRYLFAAAGIVCWLIMLMIRFDRHTEKLVRGLLKPVERLNSHLQASRLISILRSFRQRLLSWAPVVYFRRSPQRSALLFATLGAVLSVVIYLWFITSGTFTVWTPYSTYFDKLGNAFRAGQVALLEEPSAELMALENPYDWTKREGVPLLWDASFYNGKYYLYWGPVPGILAALVKSFTATPVEDQYLLFFFCCGTVILFAGLLAYLYLKIFKNRPAWTLFLLTMLAGLSVPVLWLINRPDVYETAIAGGQFFLMLGLFLAVRTVLEEPLNTGRLAGIGLAWGAAVGCRLTLAAAVIVLSAILAWIIFRRHSNWRKTICALLWLGLPLLLWAGGLAWYNDARFGNIFETGHRYQLTGPALPEDYTHVTSLGYVLPSLYSYLVRPLSFSAHEFPFVYAQFIKEAMWPKWIYLPKYYYYPEPTAGIFMAVPGVWLALLPLIGLLRGGWGWLKEEKESLRVFSGSSESMLWLLAGALFIFTFSPLLVFITTSMRYLADFTWVAGLLASLGLWWGQSFLKSRPGWRRLLALSAIVLVLTTVIFGVMVNLGNVEHRFEANNPALYGSIREFFLRGN